MERVRKALSVGAGNPKDEVDERARSHYLSMDPETYFNCSAHTGPTLRFSGTVSYRAQERWPYQNMHMSCVLLISGLLQKLEFR